MKWLALLLPLVFAAPACHHPPSTPDAVMAAVKPVLDKELTRIGQAPKSVSADEVARIAKPFDVSPQVHYLLQIEGKEAALSVYYLGNEEAKTSPLILQLSKASGAEKDAGKPVAFHLHTHNKQAFFAHLATSQGPDTGLQNVLLQIFSPGAGTEIGKALK
ncbi:MAG: hypothetical protein JNJ46_04600 [Myxococcales bacterium]|nr:hypothetical protein [Myxococcales bacterium]